MLNFLFSPNCWIPLKFVCKWEVRGSVIPEIGLCHGGATRGFPVPTSGYRQYPDVTAMMTERRRGIVVVFLFVLVWFHRLEMSLQTRKIGPSSLSLYLNPVRGLVST